MRGCILRHARSIGANESGSKFGTGWAVGWAVYPANACKLMKDWSGRVDSNHRPPGPEPGALARLSHAPRNFPDCGINRRIPSIAISRFGGRELEIQNYVLACVVNADLLHRRGEIGMFRH